MDNDRVTEYCTIYTYIVKNHKFTLHCTSSLEKRKTKKILLFPRHIYGEFFIKGFSCDLVPHSEYKPLESNANIIL